MADMATEVVKGAGRYMGRVDAMKAVGDFIKAETGQGALRSSATNS